MPDVSSAEPGAHATPARRRRAFDVPARARLAMVALGLIPAVHLAGTLLPVTLAASGRIRPSAAWLSLVILLLLPPLAVRAASMWRPLPNGRVRPGSPAFLHWWFTAQWQIVFARLPMVEEVIRMVPGLYSLWLRLWGARVGSLVYWSPGVVILDRPLVRLGDRVVFGIGARLSPHVLAPHGAERMALHIGPIAIGDDALIGAYSLLLPGCEVGAGEVTPPLRTIHAFSRFADGRRVPGAGQAAGVG